MLTVTVRNMFNAIDMHRFGLLHGSDAALFSRLVRRTVLGLGGVLCWMAGVVLVGMGLSIACNADVVLFHTGKSNPSDEEAIRKVANFYGLDIRSVDVDSPRTLGSAMPGLRNSGTLAVLISGDALSKLDKRRVQSALRRSNGQHVPMLVFGVGPEDSTELKSWSEGAIRDCSPSEDDHNAKTLKVGYVGALAPTLAGMALPAVTVP